MKLLILICCLVVRACGDPIVNGSLGNIVGKIEKVLDTHIESFLGIPYAIPPLGHLRFALPQAFGVVGDLQATEYPPPCLQVATPSTPLGDRLPNEDCLYLNVFRKQGTTKGHDKKAVIAIIHGGGYVVGGTPAPFEKAAALAGVGDVIIVTLNYRLGIFGFADMKEFAPGNLGLHDQRLALQWIQDNIADFGGDPGRVTVMGVSAGSMSVAAHIITPIDKKNLFQSVVMDAGVVDSNGFHEETESSYTRIKKIAKQVGCPVDSDEMVKCLRKTSSDSLLPLSFNTTGDNGILSFVATLDGVFIPHNVREYVARNSAKLRKVRTIIGYARDEGTSFMSRTFISSDYPNPKTVDQTLDYCEKLSEYYDYRLDFNGSKTRDAIRKLYVGENMGGPFDTVASFQSDGIFKCGIDYFIRSYSKHNAEVYVYQFDRKLQATYANMFDPDVLGAFHYSPYLHFTGAWFMNTEPIHPLDKEFSLEAMHMISNYAKSGAKELSFRGVKWPNFPKSGEVFVFNETPSVRTGLPRTRHCQELFDPANRAHAIKMRQEL